MNDLDPVALDAATKAYLDDDREHANAYGRVQCGVRAAITVYLTASRARGEDEAAMRAFGASDAACVLWPDDTDEHKALRAAYIRGAADCGDHTQASGDGWVVEAAD